MKKKRLLRNVGLVALSGVLVGGAAMTFAACGPKTPARTDYTISVYIFCGQADAMTNKTICENWARTYSEEHASELGGNTISVQFTSESLADNYYRLLGGQIQSGDYPDIIYVAPSQVLTYARNGTILDLTQYLTASQEIVDQVNSIWTDSLAFYAGYGQGLFMEHAKDIAYDSSKGFYDPESENDPALKIYGLPKDYSNFGLGYNRNYFTNTMKAAYTTLKPSAERSVTSRLYKSGNATSGVTHTGKESGAITYAVKVENVVNKYTNESITAFYKYETYADALKAGDPLAVSTDTFTLGEGYVITMPGFPGETFEITEEKFGAAAVNKNEGVAYDVNSGNIVLTWAEYGALNWACAYMLNSFAWDSNEGVRSAETLDGKADAIAEGGSGTITAADFGEWMSGQGGVYTGAGGSSSNHQELGDFNNVYGGEQYEQGDGGNLYVLPWLFSNDATYINSDYTKSMNETKDGKEIAALSNGKWSWTGGSEDDVRSRVGNATEDISKINLDGTERTAKVQYGINSENFIETYGAFQEYIATWNGHVGQAGDVVSAASDKSVNGQDVFIMGASLFYGVGTWDVSEYQEVNREILDMGVIPTAVSNKLSLYSQGRSAYYLNEDDFMDLVTYANGATQKGTGADAGTATGSTGDYKQLSDPEAGLHVYDENAIQKNQVLRQDKWAGRLDSVGYAVNGHVADEGQPAWLAPAVTDLVMELTIGEQSQVTLTYGGAQIPNVRAQCTEYLNYNTTAKDGAFKDMITPEGDAEGNDVWDQYYDVALEMAAEGMNGSTKTVAEFLADKKITIGGEETDIKYDTQYANVQLAQFTTATESTTRIAYAMRVLRMINYTRAERDILIRMETGMNSVHDQTLYTSGTGWLTTLNATSNASSFLAYINQAALNADQKDILAATAMNPSDVGQKMEGSEKLRSFMTPAVYCVNQSLTSQNALVSGT